jgi:hypothetical protein
VRTSNPTLKLFVVQKSVENKGKKGKAIPVTGRGGP